METQKIKTHTIELTFDEMRSLLDAAEHGLISYAKSGYYDREFPKDRFSSRADYITGIEKLWAAYNAAFDEIFGV